MDNKNISPEIAKNSQFNKVKILENKISIYQKENLALENKLKILQEDNEDKKNKIQEQLNHVINLENENNSLKKILENYKNQYGDHPNNRYQEKDVFALQQTIEKLKAENQKLSQSMMSQRNGDNNFVTNNYENKLNIYSNIINDELNIIAKYIDTYLNINYLNFVNVPDLQNITNFPKDQLLNFDNIINIVDNTRKKLYNQNKMYESNMKSLKQDNINLNNILEKKINENNELKKIISDYKEKNFALQNEQDKLKNDLNSQRGFNDHIQTTVNNISNGNDDYLKCLYQTVKIELDKLLQNQKYQSYMTIILDHKSNKNNINGYVNKGMKFLFEDLLEKYILLTNCIIDDYQKFNSGFDSKRNNDRNNYIFTNSNNDNFDNYKQMEITIENLNNKIMKQENIISNNRDEKNLLINQINILQKDINNLRNLRNQALNNLNYNYNNNSAFISNRMNNNRMNQEQDLKNQYDDNEVFAPNDGQSGNSGEEENNENELNNIDEEDGEGDGEMEENMYQNQQYNQNNQEEDEVELINTSQKQNKNNQINYNYGNNQIQNQYENNNQGGNDFQNQMYDYKNQEQFQENMNENQENMIEGEDYNSDVNSNNNDNQRNEIRYVNSGNNLNENYEYNASEEEMDNKQFKINKTQEINNDDINNSPS